MYRFGLVCVSVRPSVRLSVRARVSVDGFLPFPTYPYLPPAAAHCAIQPWTDFSFHCMRVSSVRLVRLVFHIHQTGSSWQHWPRTGRSAVFLLIVSAVESTLSMLVCSESFFLCLELSTVKRYSVYCLLACLKHWTCLQVRIFRFSSGKMTRVFNESLQHYSDLQQVRDFT